uniref:Uncharacterized mitochondrial protein AtMg00810-like n=1 Tax=Tanacetum cinerariifolium TaxID=118510 RepID=A0A6L2LV55_TANCI|nr:uncharacterized mitochondrial protein AtMg00810-like [Tanacetum cinerariifolium]
MDLFGIKPSKVLKNVPSFVQPIEQVKAPRPFVQHVETSVLVATSDNSIPKPTSNGKRRNRKACFVCKSLDHLIKDCDYHEKKMAQSTARNHVKRGTHKQYAQMPFLNPQRHVVPAAVLTQSKPVPITIVRPVTTTIPKLNVTRPRHAEPVVTKPNSPLRRHINHSPSPKANNFPPKDTAVKALMVNAGVQGKWEWKPKCLVLDHVNPQHALKDKGVIGSGCSRHMIGNMSYLSNFEELNGGYVAFGGNPNGGKIFGKGKFDGNVDEGFLVGYSVSSKAFRVFNSRTRLVQETLHVNFLENKPNVTEKAREDSDQQYVLFPVWSSGSTNPQNTDGDDAFDEKEPEFEGRKPESEVNVSPNSSAQSKKHDDKTKREAKGKIPAVGQISPNSTNTFSAAGPSNAAASPTHRKSSCDVGVEADFNNLEISIIVSPILTTRVHKDHPVTQIIGDLSSATQTRSMTRVAKDQGFEDPDYPDKVYKVVKALYGLHQAPRACQDKYVAEILKKFRLTDGKSASTPIDTEKPLLKDPDGEDVDVHTYRSMIGSLMYLTSSRPDIMFAVCACACFQMTPKASHLHAIKRIFRYLKGKPHLGLWYLKDSPFDLVAYSDSDYAGASLDRKSTTKGCQFLGCKLISWQCKKKTVVATSFTEAEYVAASSCCAQVLWIQNQLLDYGLELMELMVFLLLSDEKVGVEVSAVDLQTSVAVKKVNDVTRLQALVDKKKVVITEASIRDTLHLDDAEGVECLPNEEIFTELARIGYEKPSTKLTFYKAFFLSQWKFLIHTILQCMSAKRTSLNKFSSSMVFAVICLSTGRKFNFSMYIFDSLLRNVDSPTKFYLYLRFIQLMIRKQVGDISSHSTKYTSYALTQKVFANMRRVGKGFSGVETPLFERMIVEQQVDKGDAKVNVDDVPAVGVAAEGVISATNDEVPTAIEEPSIPSPTPPTPPPHTDDQGRKAESQAEIYKIELEHANKVLSMQEEESELVELQEVVDVFTTAKIITKVVTAASDTITATSTTITAADVSIPAATTVAAPTLTIAPSRRRKGVEPKSLKKQAQIEQDEAYARELEAELKKILIGMKLLIMCRESRKRIKLNVVGFKIDYFKEMTYDDIRLIFEKHYDSNVAFLQKTKEQMDEEDSRALKRLNESKEDKAAKNQKLDEEVPVVDYEIYNKNNKPYYKIKRANGSHQLYLSYLSLLRNFDREDLEVLWQLVKERFATTKPKNFSDDFLLITLGAMFEKPDIHAQI